MLYLLDTNALSDAMNEHPAFTSKMAQLHPNDDILTCVTALGEVYFGIERLEDGKRKANLRMKVTEVTRRIACHETPVAAAVHYATIKRQCQKRGRPIDENDLWIAATAAALGAVLISRDLDFSDIAAVPLEDWTRP